MAQIVTRFAPSPTGFLHVGSVRTGLYAWLYARQNSGTFILRIEDTDKAREVPGSVEHIIESLSWLGLHWDKAGDGPSGAYVQSERLGLYRQYAELLIKKGYAYPDPYTEEELAALRGAAQQEKRPFLFRDHRPDTALPWDGRQTLRFRTPEIKRYTWSDLVRGELTAGEEALDDFILIKADGYPTYNFCHIVDDIEMSVTHVIRGEEFISSTPKFLSLYDALAVEPPLFVTMPSILGTDGTRKLSKRDGAKDILAYRDEGFVPEAMVNFLALMGWHPEGNEEIFTPGELMETFALERVQKSGARFDETKLRWINHEHMRREPSEQYVTRLREYLERQGNPVPEYLSSIAGLLAERAETLGDASRLLREGEFAFMESLTAQQPSLLLAGAKTNADAAADNLLALKAVFESVPEDAWNVESVKAAAMAVADERGRSQTLWPLRVALSGREKSPDPFTIAALIGKKRTVARIKSAHQILVSA